MDYERRTTTTDCYGLRLWWTTPGITAEIEKWEHTDGAWCPFPIPHYSEMNEHWMEALKNTVPLPKKIAYDFWVRSDDLLEKIDSLTTFCEYREFCLNLAFGKTVIGEDKMN